ncbi:MAG: exonuclease SbcCD subunit D [SAR324 cluster bacterium]
MRRPLKIAHGSDSHLDTDFYDGGANLALRDYHRGVFRTFLDRVQAQEPDLMLLAGDLFDSNRASRATILWTMEQLAGLPFPILVIPGNHDQMEPDAIFFRHDFGRIGNVRLLSAAEGEGVELPKLGVAAWGKGMVEHSPEYSPLGGLPAPVAERWNLALGHGIYVGKEGFSYRSSPVEARQIEASRYDYIALGHHHALLDVSVKGTAAAYSGSPVPISKSSPGTFLIVTLGEGQSAKMVTHKL